MLFRAEISILVLLIYSNLHFLCNPRFFPFIDENLDAWCVTMRMKVFRHRDPVEVVYDDERRTLLGTFREKARKIQAALGTPSFVYGSVARGDVKASSDIDIIILDKVPSFEVELALGSAGLSISSREIVKANPNSVPKGHVYLDESTAVTVLLGQSTMREEEFYKFGGLLEAGASAEDRVPGVDKRLLFIEPTERGHIEWAIVGKEPEVAKRLGISIDVVNERVRVLTRRDRIGRTGVYLRHPLSDEESFEGALKDIMDRDNITRRQVKRRTK